MEDFDYFLEEKPSQVGNKKNKFGLGKRTGATLRRCTKKNSKQTSEVILKHVVSNGLKDERVNKDLNFDDGGLLAYGSYSNDRKTHRSVISRQPLNDIENQASYVLYSMKKKKRWLLPQVLKQEILNDASSNSKDIKLSMVERKISQNRNKQNRPDTLQAISTTQQKKKVCNGRKQKKHQSRSFSSDLLKSSENSKKNQISPDEDKPEVTYEICRNEYSRGKYLQLPVKDFKRSGKSCRKEKKSHLNADNSSLVLKPRATNKSCSKNVCEKTNKSQMNLNGSTNGKDQEKARKLKLCKSDPLSVQALKKMESSDVDHTFTTKLKSSSLKYMDYSHVSNNSPWTMVHKVILFCNDENREFTPSYPYDRVYIVLQLLSQCKECKHYNLCDPNCFGFRLVKFKLLILSDEQDMNQLMTVWRKKFKASLSSEVFSRIAEEARITLLRAAKETGNIEKFEKISTKETKINYKLNVTDNATAILGITISTLYPTYLTSWLYPNKKTAGFGHLNEKEKSCDSCFRKLSSSCKDSQTPVVFECNHSFCIQCWKNHLSSSNDHPVICPVPQCGFIIDDVTLMKYLPGDVMWKYQKQIIDKAKKSRKNLFECPQCRRLVGVNTKDSKILKTPLPLFCDCGSRWCSKCEKDSHWPADCHEIETYQKAVEIYDKEKQDASDEFFQSYCHFCIGKNVETKPNCLKCVCGFVYCVHSIHQYLKHKSLCEKHEAILEVHDMSLLNLVYDNDILEATASRKTIECPKTRKLRLELCHKLSEQQTGYVAPPLKIRSPRWNNYKSRRWNFYDSCPFPEICKKSQATWKIEKEFQKTLFFCDTMHFIAQHFIVAVNSKLKKSDPLHPSLQRLLSNFKVSITALEKSIFEKRNKGKFELEQRKKISSTKLLLIEIINCFNQA